MGPKVKLAHRQVATKEEGDRLCAAEMLARLRIWAEKEQAREEAEAAPLAAEV